MKHLLIFIIILFSIQSAAGEIIFLKKFQLENYYDNNILRLSDTDLDLFESGTATEKFELDSTDDLVTSAQLDLGIKHYFAMGHTQINKVIVRYNKYWNNPIKDDGYIRFNLQQYLSKELNFQLNYYYYPEIYSNNYKSEIDDEYHSYTYEKNVYNAGVEWKVSKFLSLRFKFEYSQIYFNKYFTEYDSDNIENRLDLRFRLLPNLFSTLSYAYKISDADAADAYDDITGSLQFKDASYEANLFFIQFVIPRLFSFKEDHARLRLKTSFEGFYFQSKLDGDDYHLQRDDNFIKLFAGLTLPVQKAIDLEIYIKRDERRTESPYSHVERDKNYCRLRTGFTLKFIF
jgi:hypothetical protein